MGSIFQNQAYRPRIVPAKKKWEESVHRAVCSYLRMQYPHVIFRTDGAGLWLSKSQAGIYKSLQSDAGYPDLFICAASRGYHGMFLEIKKEGTSIYKRNGELVANLHIKAQADMLARLNKLGYFARFAVGLGSAIKLIDWYFQKPQTKELF